MTTTNEHGVNEDYEQAVADLNPEFVKPELTPYQTNYIRGLREVADFFEAHPRFIPTYTGQCFDLFVHDKKELAEAAREFGTADKVDTDYWFTLRKKFPPHKVELCITREKVCTKVKTGTRVVEKPDPDELAKVKRIQVEEDIFEWQCPESILAPELPEDHKCDDEEA